MYFQHITVSGELGSGKSTLAQRLADSYSMDVIGTGRLQRDLARKLGVSTLELNRRAEIDHSIDDRLDGMLKVRGSDAIPHIFDSRMAWFFVPNSFKVHLIADSRVAAQRLFAVRSTSVESYSSVEEAETAARDRFRSERDRFLSRYGADIGRLQNYSLVIDTTSIDPDRAAAEVCKVLDGKGDSAYRLLIDPRRLVPTVDPVRELASAERGYTSSSYIEVGYSAPHFFIVRGHDLVSRALLARQGLVGAELRYEGTELVAPGLSADEFLYEEAQRRWIYDWEEIHQFRFSSYPQTADQR